MVIGEQRSHGYLGRDDPGQLGQAVEHGLGELRVRDVVLQEQHLVLRRLVADPAESSNEMSDLNVTNGCEKNSNFRSGLTH